MYDPKFVSFAQWLYTRGSQTDAAGAVARHVLANGFIPDAIDASGNFTPAIVECNGARMAHPGATFTSPPLFWISAPLELAAQALRGRDFDWLNVSVLHFGPNCTPAQVSTALAASGL
jgi:hypothetical protein